MAQTRLVEPFLMVRPKGLEPPTYWFVASHSIQLSYWRINIIANNIIPYFGTVVKGYFFILTEINFSKQFVINYELLKYKSLGQAFSKACGVQRQSLGRSSQ